MELAEEQILKRLNELIESEKKELLVPITHGIFIDGLVCARNLVKQSIAEANTELQEPQPQSQDTSNSEPETE